MNGLQIVTAVLVAALVYYMLVVHRYQKLAQRQNAILDDMLVRYKKLLALTRTLGKQDREKAEKILALQQERQVLERVIQGRDQVIHDLERQRAILAQSKAHTLWEPPTKDVTPSGFK